MRTSALFGAKNFGADILQTRRINFCVRLLWTAPNPNIDFDNL